MNYLSSVRFFFAVSLLSLSFQALSALEINRSDQGIVSGWGIGLSTNSSDQILVSWAEYTSTATINSQTEDSSVFAQFVSSDGELVGSATQLNTIQSAFNPQVFLNDDGSFLAAWQSDPTGTGSNSQIYVRYFDTQGTPTSTEYLVGVDDGSENLGRITVLSNGDFIIYWSESGSVNGPLFRRTFQSDGSPVTAREEIVTTAVFAQADFEQFTDTGYYAIGREAFDSVSLFSTVPFTVADLMPFQLTSAVFAGAIGDLSLSVNRQNRLVASWREGTGFESELYFTITQDDNVVANRVLAIDGYLDHASLKISEQGKFLVTWAGVHPSTTDGEANNAVFASLFTADGVVEESSILLDNSQISVVGATRTVVDDVGNFIVAWSGGSSASGPIKGVVRLQKIDQSGDVLWNENNDDGDSGGGLSDLLMLFFLLNLVVIRTLSWHRSGISSINS